MKQLLRGMGFLGLSCWLLVSLPIRTQAETRTTVSASTQELISVQLAPGYGVNISFLNSKEEIKKVWLDNPSFVTISTDGCLDSLTQQCSTSGANVLHLRRIEPLEISGLPKTSTSLLTVVTQTPGGKSQLYLFEIKKAAQPDELLLEL